MVVPPRALPPPEKGNIRGQRGGQSRASADKEARHTASATPKEGIMLHQLLSRDFSATTLRGLARKGITITGLQAIPGTGPMPYANAERGYVVADNGTGRVWTHAEVLGAAR